MTKTKFYTLCRCRNGIDVLLVNGYTDSIFHYYRSVEKWHAVHPATGLSVCTGKSRISVASVANSADMLSKINQVLDQRGSELQRVFLEKVAAFEAAAAAKRGA